jgi:23S rRNA pseudouridine2605 synthase
MRLNKYIAQAGIASRRKADELIAQGRVKINGVVMKELGYDVIPGDVVETGGSTITPDKKMAYIMLNKPLGYVVTVSDDKERPTVMNLVQDISERLFPIGRLDYNSSGMLLMTNDGDLAFKLTHPKHVIYKTYRVRVSGILSDEKASRLARGIDIGGYVTAKAVVRIEKQLERSTIVEIQISEGKNRQLRKMFAIVGNKVVELQRIAIGDLKLGHLKIGHYRKLTQKEIEYLKNS